MAKISAKEKASFNIACDSEVQEAAAHKIEVVHEVLDSSGTDATLPFASQGDL